MKPETIENNSLQKPDCAKSHSLDKITQPTITLMVKGGFTLR